MFRAGFARTRFIIPTVDVKLCFFVGADAHIGPMWFFDVIHGGRGWNGILRRGSGCAMRVPTPEAFTHQQSQPFKM